MAVSVLAEKAGHDPSMYRNLGASSFSKPGHVMRWRHKTQWSLSAARDGTVADLQQSSLVSWGQYSRTEAPPVRNFSTVAFSFAVGFCSSSSSSSPLRRRCHYCQFANFLYS